MNRGGNHRVPHDTICNTWPTIPIILRYSDSAIINILWDNPINPINECNITVKRLNTGYPSLFMVQTSVFQLLCFCLLTSIQVYLIHVLSATLTSNEVLTVGEGRSVERALLYQLKYRYLAVLVSHEDGRRYISLAMFCPTPMCKNKALLSCWVGKQKHDPAEL